MTTETEIKAITKQIDALYRKLRSLLRELAGQDNFRWTTWHADLMEEAESLRGRIRKAELELAEYS